MTYNASTRDSGNNLGDQRASQVIKSGPEAIKSENTVAVGFLRTALILLTLKITVRSSIETSFRNSNVSARGARGWGFRRRMQTREAGGSK